MKKIVEPWVAFAGLYLVYFILLFVSVSSLPDPLATHFDLAGHPNGWMGRPGYLAFMVLFGLAFPLFTAGLSFLSRFFPDRFLNIPRRHYWLAPAKRDETFAYLFHHSLWFACLALGFVTGIHLLTVQANRGSQPMLGLLGVLGLAATFLIGTAVWGVRMLRHFQRGS